MVTIYFINFIVLTVKLIVKGTVGILSYTYKIFRYTILNSYLTSWPEEIKVPMVIAAIDKE